MNEEIVSVPVVSDAMTIKPAGHSSVPQIIPIRQENTLQEMLQRWQCTVSMLDARDMNRPAQEQVPLRKVVEMSIEGFFPEIEEIHAFLLHPSMQKEQRYMVLAGHFTSALYRDAPVVEFDLRLPALTDVSKCYNNLFINRGRIGCYASTPGGVFMNYGRIGDDCCTMDTVGLNAGEAGAFFGYANEAMIINDGSAGSAFGLEASGTMIILQQPRSFGFHSSTVVNKAELSAESREYIRKLEETCRGTTADIIKEYGPQPAQAIRTKLAELLGVKL